VFYAGGGRNPAVPEPPATATDGVATETEKGNGDGVGFAQPSPETVRRHLYKPIIILKVFLSALSTWQRLFDNIHQFTDGKASLTRGKSCADYWVAGNKVIEMNGKKLEKPYGEILHEDGDGSVFCMRLPEDVEYNMTFSGWLFSRVFDAKLNAIILHSCGKTFVSFDQFSLVKADAKPIFKATGPQAREALEILKGSFLSFNPSDFDADGYKTN